MKKKPKIIEKVEEIIDRKTTNLPGKPAPMVINPDVKREPLRIVDSTFK